MDKYAFLLELNSNLELKITGNEINGDLGNLTFRISFTPDVSLRGFSVVLTVETVGIVSIVFLPKNALIPDVLSNTHRIPIARTMMTRNVMRPARPGSLADLGSFIFFFVFLTVVTGEMLLS